MGQALTFFGAPLTVNEISVLAQLSREFVIVPRFWK